MSIEGPIHLLEVLVDVSQRGELVVITIKVITDLLGAELKRGELVGRTTKVTTDLLWAELKRSELVVITIKVTTDLLGTELKRGELFVRTIKVTMPWLTWSLLSYLLVINGQAKQVLALGFR